MCVFFRVFFFSVSVFSCFFLCFCTYVSLCGLLVCVCMFFFVSVLCVFRLLVVFLVFLVLVFVLPDVLPYFLRFLRFFVSLFDFTAFLDAGGRGRGGRDRRGGHRPPTFHGDGRRRRRRRHLPWDR